METIQPSVRVMLKSWFKSYYVVWKPVYRFVIYSPVTRLNRTMQYGNENAIMQQKEHTQFKSYYVVWKQKAVAKKKIILKRLNRTMQYGNEKQSTSCAREKRV